MCSLQKMGKKNKQVLGKSIIKQRTKSGGNIKHANSWLHCSELDTGTGPNVQSITEQTDLDDFLATAELAGTEFAAEKLNTSILTAQHNEGLLNTEKAAAIKQAQQEHQHFLRIPRRPEWNENMTADKLDQQERDSFLDWRRQLAQLQEKEHILLTPFERNLDFWRQLWRVIERSDVVVQIVDARNPLLFRCEDLEKYVTEVDPNKCNLLLVNKADFLTPQQRHSWAAYFRSIDLPVAFWSAEQENDRLKALRAVDEEKILERKEKDNEMDKGINREEEDSYEQNNTLWAKLSEMVIEKDAGDSQKEQREMLDDPSIVNYATNSPVESQKEQQKMHINPGIGNDAANSSAESFSDALRFSEQTCRAGVSSSTKDCGPCSQNTKKDSCNGECEQLNTKNLPEQEESLPTAVIDSHVVEGRQSSEEHSADASEGFQHSVPAIDEFSGRLLTRDELLALFKMLHMKKAQKTAEGSQKVLTTVGLVGYPNVGKSSTINTLLIDKKVPVSATPGRTKHFQTLYVNDEVLLCDCPGLVFPSFVSTKADMILNGILPIDQMRDHLPSVSLLCQRIPRDVLEAVYGINIIPPKEEEEFDRAPLADELLSAYGYIRGFMTSHGIPDGSRSARYILKDYVKGKLRYCIAPPGEDEKEFQQMGYKPQKLVDFEGKEVKGKDKTPKQMNDVDKDFFKQEQVRCFSRGTPSGPRPFGTVSEQGAAMPYKPWKKHHNKNKREKLRRLVNK